MIVNRTKKNHQKGFTLIELLVVITILGILAAIAIPIYKVQTIKAKLTEVTNTMSHVASALVIYRHNAIQSGVPNVWPNCGNVADIQTSLGVGLAAVGRISAASIDQGTGMIAVMVANIDGTVDGSTITLAPSIATDSSISWKWGGTLLPKYLPKE